MGFNSAFKGLILSPHPRVDFQTVNFLPDFLHPKSSVCFCQQLDEPSPSSIAFVPISMIIFVFYFLLTVHLATIFVNNQLDPQFFFMYVYFYSLHVSGSHVPIIRRINCINKTSGIYHSVQMIIQCAGLDQTAVSSKPAHQTVICTQ